MKIANPVIADSRKVKDQIEMFDNLSGKSMFHHVGIIIKITHKIITVRTSTGFEQKYHRATGFQVGYRWPYATACIAPETSGN